MVTRELKKIAPLGADIEKCDYESALIFALARGRLLDDTVPLLTELGIEPTESLTGSRKLMFETRIQKSSF